MTELVGSKGKAIKLNRKCAGTLYHVCVACCHIRHLRKVCRYHDWVAYRWAVAPGSRGSAAWKTPPWNDRGTNGARPCSGKRGVEWLAVGTIMEMPWRGPARGTDRGGAWDLVRESGESKDSPWERSWNCLGGALFGKPFGEVPGQDLVRESGESRDSPWERSWNRLGGTLVGKGRGWKSGRPR